MFSRFLESTKGNSKWFNVEPFGQALSNSNTYSTSKQTWGCKVSLFRKNNHNRQRCRLCAWYQFKVRYGISILFELTKLLIKTVALRSTIISGIAIFICLPYGVPYGVPQFFQFSILLCSY